MKTTLLTLFLSLCVEKNDSKYLHIAPMQCYTNKHLRMLYRMLNSNVILWTEMEKVTDLLISENAMRRRLDYDTQESPLILQLGGNNIHSFQQILPRINQKYDFIEYNLNCGCPSIETGGADYGASLMLQPQLTRQLVETIAHYTRKPVSVKCRINAHMNLLSDNTIPDDSYNTLYQYIHDITLTKAVSHVIIHARSAILSGLSSVKNRSIPPLHYDYVTCIKHDFSHLQITLNGGIKNIHQLYTHMYDSSQQQKIDGYMIGRWALQRPLDIYSINTLCPISPSSSYMMSPSTSYLYGTNINHINQDSINSNIPTTTTTTSASSSSSSSSNSSRNSRNNGIYTNKHTLVDCIQQYCQYVSIQLISLKSQSKSQSKSKSQDIVLSEVLLPLILIIKQLEDDYHIHIHIDNIDNGDNIMHSSSSSSSCSSIDSDSITSSSSSVSSSSLNTLLSLSDIYQLFTIIWDTCYTYLLSSQEQIKYATYKPAAYYSAEYNEDIPFKKLLQIIASKLGKKVMNKILKNRAEDCGVRE